MRLEKDKTLVGDKTQSIKVSFVMFTCRGLGGEQHSKIFKNDCWPKCPLLKCKLKNDGNNVATFG